MDIKSSFYFFLSLFICIAFIFCLTGFNEKAYSSEKIVFYLEDEPIYTSSNRISPGFLLEVVKEMTKYIGVTPNIEFLPWKRAQLMTINTPNAVIFPLTRSQSREKNYRWLCKILEVPVMFINKEGDAPINTIEQAKDIRGIGVIRGTPQEEFLIKNGVPHITMTGKEIYSKLAANRITAVFTAKPEAIFGWKNGNYKEILQFWPGFQTLPLWIATSKLSDQVNTHKWNEAFIQVIDSGFFDSMQMKYFGSQK